MFVPFEPVEKRLREACPQGVDENTFKNAFRANVKTLNMGLELFKFVSPAEVAWWTYDNNKKANPGFQGPLTNNYAWWNKAQMWRISGEDIKARYPNAKQADGSAYTPDQIAALDGLWPTPSGTTGINTLLYPGEKEYGDYWHSPANYTKDPQHPANDRSWFGVTHRSSPWLYGGPLQGSFVGTLYNVNPFAGVAGGYGNAALNNYNTWNHFQTSEANKTNWDFGLSTGYQSAFAVDNAKGDWGTVNNTLTDISKQAIYMKDSHFGYDLVDGTKGFHDSALGIEPLSSSKTWSKISGDPNLSTKFKSYCADPYNEGQTATQAPSYYEIVDSGAWCQWNKDFNLETWKSNPDNAAQLTLENIDAAKFYNFSKAMLESKRRGYEALGNMLGKIKHISNAIEQKFYTGDSVAADWQQPLYGKSKDVNNPDPEDPGTAAQCKDIQDWYNNVIKNQPQENTVMNFLFFSIGHGFFNNLEKFFQLDNDVYAYGVGPYGDHGPFPSFRRASIPACYKYLSDDNNANGINNLMTALRSAAVNDGVVTKTVTTTTTKKSDGTDEVTETITYGGDQYILDLLKFDYKTGVDNKNINNIYDKLLELYNKCETKILDMKSKNQGVATQKALLTIENALAPITELFHKIRPTVDDSISFKVPTVNFATYEKENPDFNDLDWDYLARESTIYSTSNKARTYSGMAGFKGFGISWWGLNNRRDGLMNVFRMNPVPGMPYTWLYKESDMDTSMQVVTNPAGLAPGAYVKTANPDWLLDPNTRANLYGYNDGSYHWNDPAKGAVRGETLEISQNPSYAAATFSYQGIWYIGNENMMRFNLNAVRYNQYKSQKEDYSKAEDVKTDDEIEYQRGEARKTQEALNDRKRFEAIMAARNKSSSKKK
jgi:hypothetical protein